MTILKILALFVVLTLGCCAGTYRVAPENLIMWGNRPETFMDNMKNAYGWDTCWVEEANIKTIKVKCRCFD